MSDKIHINTNDGSEFEVSDSEDNYSDEEKELLQEVRQGKRHNKEEGRKQLMEFDDSDDDDEDAEHDVEQMMGDSDIEGATDDENDLPDSKDWGKKASSYYNTDFVDPDFDAYNAEQEELAKAEEQEAKAIQLRLAQQMGDDDFLFGDTKIKSKHESKKLEGEIIKVKADFAGLSQREKQQLFQKDSPEFAGLINDFQTFIEESNSLLSPVLNYVDKNNVPLIPALQFARTYQNIALSYCSNIAFYLLLKSKRISIRSHPITRRLVELKQLLSQLKDKHENIIKPQMEALLERIGDGDKFEVLAQTATNKRNKQHIAQTENANSEDEASSSEEDNEDANHEDMVAEQDEDNEDARRGITYQIAKNKGLTPHRKKELRNPRVKHRSKFRKALIRRKGAVRTVRTETKRYGGEISGIKSSVSKSIKFKS